MPKPGQVNHGSCVILNPTWWNPSQKQQIMQQHCMGAAGTFIILNYVGWNPFCIAFGEVTVIIVKSVTSQMQSNWLYIRMKHNIHEHQQQQCYNAQYKLTISLKTQWPRATPYIK